MQNNIYILTDPTTRTIHLLVGVSKVKRMQSFCQLLFI